MPTPVVQIAAAVAVATLATVAAIFDHIGGEALIGVYAAALGYIFGVVNGGIIARKETKSDTTAT